MNGDAWRWRVRLVTDEWVEEQVAGSFLDLPLELVRAVELLPVGDRWPRRRSPVRVEVPQGALPICFRRRQVVVPFGGAGPVVPRGTLSCIGWQREGAGAYLFVADDGSAELRGTRG